MTTRDLFTCHRLRCTKQRCAIYEALLAERTHPSAEELYRRVGPSGPARATVYNTLEALCNAGLIRRLPSARGCCRYDADTSEHPHVCLREDGEIRDVPDELGARLTAELPAGVIAEIEGELGVELDRISIQLIGRRRNGEA